MKSSFLRVILLGLAIFSSQNVKPEDYDVVRIKQSIGKITKIGVPALVSFYSFAGAFLNEFSLIACASPNPEKEIEAVAKWQKGRWKTKLAIVVGLASGSLAIYNYLNLK